MTFMIGCFSKTSMNANMQHVFTLCGNDYTVKTHLCETNENAKSCNIIIFLTATHQSSEIPHMQTTTFNKKYASKTCHLSGRSLRTPLSNKWSLMLPKKMITNRIVCLRHETSQNHKPLFCSCDVFLGAKQKSNHAGFVHVLHPGQAWQKHFWETTPSINSPNMHFVCPFSHTTTQKRQYTCCKKWLRLFVFSKCSTRN